MATTHRVNPIAAYDIDGNVIPPTQYGTLAGATVRASISMVHWDIGGGFGAERKDTYVADIMKFRVITPAAPTAIKATASARKRKLSPQDSGASPSKKAREREAAGVRCVHAFYSGTYSDETPA